MRMLQEMAEIGMEIVRSLKERVEIDLHTARQLAAHAEGPEGYMEPAHFPAPLADAPAMFARITRAVRLTMVLEAKTAERLRALLAGIPIELEKRRVEAARRETVDARARHEAAKKKVSDRVTEVIDREALDDEDCGDLNEALEERLEDDEAYFQIEDIPLREAVELICADLGLAPDWSRWDGDGWKADGPPQRRSPTSPFNVVSRKAIDPDSIWVRGSPAWDP